MIEVFSNEKFCVNVDSLNVNETTVAEVEYKDTGMIIRFEGTALDIYQEHCAMEGGILATLEARLPEPQHQLKDVEGFTIVNPGRKPSAAEVQQQQSEVEAGLDPLEL